MSKSIRSLIRTAARFPLIGPVIQELYFLQQRAAHRKLIEPYKARHSPTGSARVVETPLLIGYFETGFGLGEYIRGLASALDAVGFPFAVYPYNSFTSRPRDEAPWASRYDVTNVHAINIFCMAPDQIANARRTIGKRHFEQSYNILIAPWELPRAPAPWRYDLEFFDELWPLSHFVADAFRPIFSKPMMVVPPCIDVDAGVAPDRQKFGLDAQRYYFFFSFDFNSRPQRKNPGAIVRAFTLAFGDRSDDVGLIFKTSGADDPFPQEAGELEAAARLDPRITILHGTWKKSDVLMLLASIDCYVSLHRSEGFGIGLAEAMALGKPVIATNFSGNTDFLTAETGYPVPYQMRAVGRGEYPHHEGNSWAEPNVKVAAEMMRIVASKSDDVRKTALNAQTFVRQNYGPKAIGELAAARLRKLIPALSGEESADVGRA